MRLFVFFMQGGRSDTGKGDGPLKLYAQIARANSFHFKGCHDDDGDKASDVEQVQEKKTG
ncbi:hypothetical protein HN51_052164 [Arachis hypogaea]